MKRISEPIRTEVESGESVVIVPICDVPRFPRTLETDLNGLITAGFRIAAIREPRPTEMMAREHPWLVRWREHAAIFPSVAAEKPGTSR